MVKIRIPRVSQPPRSTLEAEINRLKQELETERSSNKQLRASLDVMQIGWDLDKQKLLDTDSKLEKSFTVQDVSTNRKSNGISLTVQSKENPQTQVSEKQMNSDTFLLTCSVCCKETFPNVEEFQKHLRTVAVNLVCPFCVKKKCLCSLIKHLDKGCVRKGILPIKPYKSIPYHYLTKEAETQTETSMDLPIQDLVAMVSVKMVETLDKNGVKRVLPHIIMEPVSKAIPFQCVEPIVKKVAENSNLAPLNSFNKQCNTTSTSVKSVSLQTQPTNLHTQSLTCELHSEKRNEKENNYTVVPQTHQQAQPSTSEIAENKTTFESTEKFVIPILGSKTPDGKVGKTAEKLPVSNSKIKKNSKPDAKLLDLKSKYDKTDEPVGKKYSEVNKNKPERKGRPTRKSALSEISSDMENDKPVDKIDFVQVCESLDKQESSNSMMLYSLETSKTHDGKKSNKSVEKLSLLEIAKSEGDKSIDKSFSKLSKNGNNTKHGESAVKTLSEVSISKVKNHCKNNDTSSSVESNPYQTVDKQAVGTVLELEENSPDLTSVENTSTGFKSQSDVKTPSLDKNDFIEKGQIKKRKAGRSKEGKTTTLSVANNFNKECGVNNNIGNSTIKESGTNNLNSKDSASSSSTSYANREGAVICPNRKSNTGDSDKTSTNNGKEKESSASNSKKEGDGDNAERSGSNSIAGGSGNDMFYCSSCEIYFKSVVQHLETHHSGEEVEIEDDAYQEVPDDLRQKLVCKAEAEDTEKVKQMLLNKPSNVHNTESRENNQSEENRTNFKRSKNASTQENKKMKRNSKTGRRRQKKKKIQPIRCSSCNKMYANKFFFEQHLCKGVTKEKPLSKEAADYGIKMYSEQKQDITTKKSSVKYRTKKFSRIAEMQQKEKLMSHKIPLKEHKLLKCEVVLKDIGTKQSALKRKYDTKQTSNDEELVQVKKSSTGNMEDMNVNISTENDKEIYEVTKFSEGKNKKVKIKESLVKNNKESEHIEKSSTEDTKEINATKPSLIQDKIQSLASELTGEVNEERGHSLERNEELSVAKMLSTVDDLEIITDEKIPSENSEKKDRVKTGENDNNCALCLIEFTSLRQAKKHKQLHDNKDAFHCQQCPCVYPLRLLLQEHIRNEHGKSQE